MIDKNYSREGVIHISSPTIRNGKVIKVLHMNTLFDMFPECNFNTEEKRENDQEHNDSLQSSYRVVFFYYLNIPAYLLRFLSCFH